ncbi:MAG: hypothetical protein U1F56_13790 [Rubrivivax sp.]
MTTPIHRLCLPALLALSAATLAPVAQAADNPAVGCSVGVDYQRNNVLGHAYRQSFVVDTLTPYVEDFSSATRIREFRATVSRAGSDVVVNIDYYNDVGVFVSVGFTTSLTLRGGGAPQTATGTHNTYVTNLAAGAGGTHTTSYTLTCQRV